MKDCNNCKHEDCWEHAEPCSSCTTRITGEPTNWEPQTNGDCIRASTDEELARRFATFNEWTQEAPVNFNHEDVYQFWLDWLKQEAEEDE